MRVEHLREFVCLVRHMGYRAAAKELYIAPSTLSAHIALLEAEVGSALLERNAKGTASLTEAGAAFYAGAQDALKALDAAMERCRQISAERPAARVAAGRDHARLLYDHQEATGRSFQLIECNLAKESLYQSLVDGRADVCISVSPRASAELASRAKQLGLSHLELEETRQYIVMQKSNALSGMSELRSDDLAGKPFVVHAVFDHLAMEQVHRSALASVPGIKIDHEPISGSFKNVIFRSLGDRMMLQPAETVSDLQMTRSDLAVFDTIDGMPITLSTAILWRENNSSAEEYARSLHAFASLR